MSHQDNLPDNHDAWALQHAAEMLLAADRLTADDMKNAPEMLMRAAAILATNVAERLADKLDLPGNDT